MTCQYHYVLEETICSTHKPKEGHLSHFLPVMVLEFELSNKTASKSKKMYTGVKLE